MSKLILADLSRLFRSIWFWACGLLMLLYSLWQAVDLLSWAVNGPWEGQALDYVTCRVGDFTVPMLILLPVLCALFLGADYHNGTMRNKVVPGYTRRQVYLSGFAAMLAAAMIYAAVHVLIVTVCGLFIKSQTWDIGAYGARLLSCLPYILGVAALGTMLAMLISARALPVLAILLSVGLLWLPQYLFEQLSYARQTVSTEYVQTVIDPDGSVTYMRNGEEIAEEDLDRVLSPRYVPEPRRSVYRFLMESLPGGQAFWLSESIDIDGGALYMAACSLTLAAGSTALGLTLFKRKDLK